MVIVVNVSSNHSLHPVCFPSLNCIVVDCWCSKIDGYNTFSLNFVFSSFVCFDYGHAFLFFR